MDLTYITSTAQNAPLPQRHNAAKEALQKILLGALARHGMLNDIAFIGGTALRLLHKLPRYSEDLDFICTSPVSSDFFGTFQRTLVTASSKIGLTAHLSSQGPFPIDARVPKHAYKIHLAATSRAFAPFARDGLQVSFEFDLDPPEHTEPAVHTILLADTPVTIPTLTLPSLMSGKLHILLTRKDREKGRDWFDYLWYRRNEITPNVPQLQSAIKQSDSGPEARYWMSFIRERITRVNWTNIRHDARAFLENTDESRWLQEPYAKELTPYPSFTDVEADFGRLGSNDPMFSPDSPIALSVEEAANTGHEAAIAIHCLLLEARQKQSSSTRNAMSPQSPPSRLPKGDGDHMSTKPQDIQHPPTDPEITEGH